MITSHSNNQNANNKKAPMYRGFFMSNISNDKFKRLILEIYLEK